MSEAVVRWREFLPAVFVLPHPSWRTAFWLRGNPWFESEALPELRSTGRRGAQSDISIRSMSSSLKPKWWPISWISTWRTRSPRSSPVSHQ